MSDDVKTRCGSRVNLFKKEPEPGEFNRHAGFLCLACDARQPACCDYVQMQSFPQPLSHDQVGVYALGRVAGDSPFEAAGTF